MTNSGGISGLRRAGVALLSLALLSGAFELVALSATHWNGSLLPLQVPWWALIPAYVAAQQMRLDYEFRRETHGFHLSHVPLAIGIVFVSPWLHLLACLVAIAVDSVLLMRQRPAKAVFNIALVGFETAGAITVSGLIQSRPDAGAMLWLAIFSALLTAEVLGFLAMQILLALVGAKQSGSERLASLATSMAAAAVFGGLAIVSVAAIWTDPLTLAVIVLVALSLIGGFQGHRRLAAQQQQTAQLHQFVKALGPLDLERPDALDVLDHVRELLNAQHLELALQDGAGWRRVHVKDAGSGPGEATPSLPDEALAGAARTSAAALQSGDHMTTPLLGAHNLMGVITVRERLGDSRTFGLRDLRMLETIATELASALERGRLQRDLALAATTDPLTHLPNLNEVTGRLETMLVAAASTVIATVAVDSFREVNDTLGHEVGDELLLEVTRRLTMSYPDALIGRIGGGRFAVCVPQTSFDGDPAMFGLGLRAQVEGGAQLGPIGTHIKLSVGCVRAPDHGHDAATLIRRAETAMYSARHAHGGPVVWEPAYEVEGQRRLAVVMALREALASGAIGVAYQPKVSCVTGEVTGVEALARWTHPALGAISPGEFVPLAEAAGLMGPLTSSVLRQSLTACKGWQRRGGRVGVAVNVSADTVLDPNFVTEVAAILTGINISPDLLTIELTESVVVTDPALATVRMGELRALGVKISVDDFGTGYSSLTYLKGLPVDEVKIDKGFVDMIAHDAGDRSVVRAVVDIAHTLGLRVVAEGVEQEEQHELLGALGVDEVQGYLHARPMAAVDMAQWLRRRDAVLTEDA